MSRSPTSLTTDQPDRPDRRHLATDHVLAQGLVGAATTLAVSTVVLAQGASPRRASFLAVVVVCYGVLSAIDLAEQRLPNRITLPLAAATIVVVLADDVIDREPGAALGSMAVGLTFAATLLLLRFGMGDVKLAFTVGTIAAWLGAEAVLATILVGSLAGAAIALTLVIIHRRWDLTFGFGPVLALGSLAGMVAAVT